MVQRTTLYAFLSLLFTSRVITLSTPFEVLMSNSIPIADIQYSVDNVPFRYHLPLLSNIVGQLSIEKNVNILSNNDYELLFTITNNNETQVKLKHLEFQFDSDLSLQVMLAEGFQCWSTTKEMDRYNRLSPIPSAVAKITQFNLQGDYDFFNYSGLPGHIHSTAFTYFRNTQSDNISFLGSLSESSGYTYFKADLLHNKFSIYKDIQGKILHKDEPLLLKFYVSQQDSVQGLRSVWSKYAEYYSPSHHPKHLTGWSSWYNVYERVTENDVLASLSAFQKHNYPIDVFQIDDGFETQVGDWLDVDLIKFPRGMKALADDIKRQDYIPGIWLAPYAVSFKSKIVEQHPEWLLKHPDGSLVVAGPNWGGFYAIDIYHQDARQHLQNVFDQVIDVWGYKLLKLDFLFAAAMIPRLGKSRGEIMWDAMELVVEFTKNRAVLLSCGVPLPSIWGRFAYTRVSSDASPWWDDFILRSFHVRERVSTFNAITSTLNRWAMAGTMIGGDPDVFFIRSNNNKLTKDEKHTLLVINIVFGQLVLMSDNVDQYSPQEHQLYASIFPKPEATVQEVRLIGNDIYQAKYICNGREYIFVTNLSPLPATVQLPPGEDDYFELGNILLGNPRLDWVKSNSHIFLKSHETRKFMKLSKNDSFMGSTANIVPGAELEELVKEEDAVYIHLKKPYVQQPSTAFFIRLDTQLPTVYIDNKLAKVERFMHKDMTLAKVTI